MHGNLGTEGAVKSVESVADALGWRRIVAPVTVTRAPGKRDLEACRELGATDAATLAG